MAWCYITPIACWFITNGSNPRANRLVSRYSWTVTACLLTQIIIRMSLSSYLLPIKLTPHLSIYRSRAYNPHNLPTHPIGPKRSSRPSTVQIQPFRTSFITSTPHESIHSGAFPKRNYKSSLYSIKCTPTTIRLHPSGIVCRKSSRERRANRHATPPHPRRKNCDRSLDGWRVREFSITFIYPYYCHSLVSSCQIPGITLCTNTPVDCRSASCEHEDVILQLSPTTVTLGRCLLKLALRRR